MKQHLMIVKLGGSLITDKTKRLTAKPEHIAFIAAELSQARSKNPDVDFIIGNGGGSFGHFLAHDYGLREGAKTPNQLLGMCLTHSAVQQLNSMVTNELTVKGMPAFSIEPSSVLICDSGELSGKNLSALNNLLNAGIAPTVYGDTITDKARGTTILSTEKILQICLEELRPKYKKITVAYLLDIKGVLDQNGQVIAQLPLGQEIKIHSKLDHDVTGGITSKVSSARLAANLADAVYLASGKTPGVIAAIISGKSAGTKILNSQPLAGPIAKPEILLNLYMFNAKYR